MTAPLTPYEWADLYTSEREREREHFAGLRSYWWSTLGMDIHDLPWPTADEVRAAAAAGQSEVYGAPHTVPSEEVWRVRVHLHPNGYIDIAPARRSR